MWWLKMTEHIICFFLLCIYPEIFINFVTPQHIISSPNIASRSTKLSSATPLQCTLHCHWLPTVFVISMCLVVLGFVAQWDRMLYGRWKPCVFWTALAYVRSSNALCQRSGCEDHQKGCEEVETHPILVFPFLNTIQNCRGLRNILPALPNITCVLKLDSDGRRLCSFKVNPVFRDSWNLQLPWNILSRQLQLQVPLSYLFPVIPDRLGKYISFFNEAQYSF